MHKIFSSKDDRELLEAAIDTKNKAHFDVLTGKNPTLVFFVSSVFLKNIDKQTWSVCFNHLKDEDETQPALEYLTKKRRYLVGLSKLDAGLSGNERQKTEKALGVLKSQLKSLTEHLKEKADELQLAAEWDKVEAPEQPVQGNTLESELEEHQVEAGKPEEATGACLVM